MIFKIRSYGDVEIKDPIVQEIINTKEMQRLKKISQHAIFFIHPWMDISRFEHSIGVYHLLRKLGAPKEEQIAGLIHDIGHTTFSHVIDFVFKRHSQENYHEDHTELILTQGKIPEILEKNNLDIKRIINHSNFSLLEKDIPDLCADRLDYFLRDAHIWNILSLEKHNQILNNLSVFENQIIFKDINLAKLTADKYKETNTKLWATPRYIGSYHVLAEAIKKGINIGAINKQDFFSEDLILLEKLKTSSDKEILNNLNMLNPAFEVDVVDETKNPDVCIQKKIRYLDPKILINDSLKKLSDVDDNFKKEIDVYIYNQKKHTCIKIKK